MQKTTWILLGHYTALEMLRHLRGKYLDGTRYDHSQLRQSLNPHTEGVWAPLGSLTFKFSEVMESEGRASVNHELN